MLWRVIRQGEGDSVAILRGSWRRRTGKLFGVLFEVLMKLVIGFGCGLGLLRFCSLVIENRTTVKQIAVD